MKLNSQLEQSDRYCPKAPTCNKGVWEWIISENKIICTQRWSRLFTENKLLPTSIDELLSHIEPISSKKIKNGLNELVAGKANSFTTVYSKKENGDVNYYRHYSEIAEWDKDKKPVRIVGVEEDITTRQLIEEKFKETNHRFAMLMQSLNGGVLVENSLGEIIFVNKKFCELFEIKVEPELLIGANYVEELRQSSHLFHDPAKFFLGIEETLQLGVPESSFKIELTNRQVLERDFIPLIFDNQLRGNLWFYKDITKFTQIERSLTFRLRFEELLTNLSFNFLRSDDQNFDAGIDKALEQIGKFIRADRSYLYLFTSQTKKMRLTNEWCGEGTSSWKNDFQDVDTSFYPWWMQKLLRFETILISSVPDLPAQASAEKELLTRQGIKSLVAVPMVYGNQLLGFIGFDSNNRYRRGDQESIKLLKMASNMLINALKRKDNEDALTQSEHKYRSVVNSINEIIFQTDAVGNWTFLNSAWTKITGFSLDESLGKSFLDFVHPEDRQRNTDLFQPLIERKKDHCNHEIRYLTKDGGFKWIDVYALLTLNEKDEIIGTSGILRDITSRRESASEIKRLNQAVETNPTAVMLTDSDGKIIYANQSLLKIGKYKSEDFVGKYSAEFMDEKSRSVLINEVRPHLANKIDWRGELTLFRSDGTLFPAEVISSVVNDVEGNAEYFLVNFNDITERKKAEEDIKVSLQKEKDLNELKSKFVSFVSHEFRTPLTAILSSAEMLEMYGGQLDETKKQVHYSNIKKSIDNLIVLLNDVTEINRADSGKIKVNPEEFELVSYLTELVNEIKVSYPECPELIWDIPFEEMTVDLDLKLFRQLSSNLISNAIKYTPEDKKVYITLAEDGDKFSLIVKDEGIGISDEDQKNIFEPFIRGKNVAKIKGTGLGLAILKRAANLLQGSLNLESKINVGTTLAVTLPKKIDSMFRTRM